MHPTSVCLLLTFCQTIAMEHMTSSPAGWALPKVKHRVLLIHLDTCPELLRAQHSVDIIKCSFLFFQICPLNSSVLSQPGYLGSKLATVLREWGSVSNCSRCARSWRKWGRRALSYAQQFFMSSYRGAGQSTGGGSRYPSSILFITYSRGQGRLP